MSQNTGIVKGAAAPTSADACMSIVHSLMCYRQGAGDRGESEQVCFIRIMNKHIWAAVVV